MTNSIYTTEAKQLKAPCIHAAELKQRHSS